MIQDGFVLSEINSVASLTEDVLRRLLEAGYLGEIANRFDEILDGFGGKGEMHVTTSSWIQLDTSVNDRAQRRNPNIVFNVVVTDLYPNGDTLVKVYRDVKWGPFSVGNASRSDYTKVGFEFKCSERPVTLNAIP